ncbi:MAG TPA: PH domain-containing protein [Frankiaceae bacterium]|nr:PH domain-containing protein [Frankiaceae bacterium]
MTKQDRLLAKAADHYEPGETAVASVTGTYVTRLMGSETVRQGVLVATDRRVVFYGKKLGGYDLESFPYPNITSFEQGRNMLGHHVTFFAAGNAVHMKWIKDLKDMEAFTRTVKAAMTAAAARTAAPPAPPAPPAQPDVVDQLRRLGELRDSGIVTPEEFEAKKAELLGRL